MAWVENLTWEMEQGLPGVLELRIFSDEAGTTPWPFTGWQVKATVSDEEGQVLYPITPVLDAANGIVKLKLPESSVNQLNAEQAYRYDALMISPEGLEADLFLATGPVLVSLRSTRRSQS